MIKNQFTDPFNWFGKLVHLKGYQQLCLFVGIFVLALSYPIMQWLDFHHRQSALEAEMTQIQTALEHQQKIKQSLVQQSESQQLSPELAAQVLPINQRLQGFAKANRLNHELRWELTGKPILHLTLKGHFKQAKAFIHQVLEAYPALQTGRLTMEKADETLQTTLILQLNTQLENPLSRTVEHKESTK